MIVAIIRKNPDTDNGGLRAIVAKTVTVDPVNGGWLVFRDLLEDPDAEARSIPLPLVKAVYSTNEHLSL